MHLNMQQINIARLKQALASEKSLVFAYLFGSFATGENTPLSDIDIAVYPAHNPALDERLGIIQRLSKELRLDRLDITFLNRCENLYLLEAILDHGILLLDRDPDLREYFEVMTHHKFLDFQFQRKLYMGD